jgi:predicted  nucleic acid-binding Zn-ribbon protein
VDWARARREATRQLADVRRRLTAAERTLAGLQQQRKRAETQFDEASERVTEAEQALDSARGERERSRRSARDR